MRNSSLITIVLIMLSFTSLAQKFPYVDTIKFLDKKLPDFEAETLDNSVFKMSSNRGKVVLVNFWSLSCSVCFKEIIDLNRLVKKYSSNDLVVVSIMPDSKEDIAKKISKSGDWYKLYKPIFNNQDINYMIIPDGKEIMSKYFSEFSFPKSFIIDRKGILRQYNTGYLVVYSDKVNPEDVNYLNLNVTIEKLIAVK